MDRSTLFSESNYKNLLRQRHKLEVKARPKLTWKFIADRVRLQHTYVSRSFHREDVHLSEDHLFEVMDLLRFDPLEKEYVLLLRTRDLAQSETRRAYIQQKIDALVKDHYVRVNSVKKAATPEETAFLMNPTLLLIYVSLHIKRYQNSPALLGEVFGLTRVQLETHLRQLQDTGHIRFDPERFTVSEVKQSSMHFSKEHPLMRGHQQILRHLCAAHLSRLEEHEKVSFMASFSASEGAFGKIKEEFYKFLSAAQKHAAEGAGEHVYQFNFDLFRWD